MNICLNMIVKNESRVILRCLRSVVGFVSSFLIHDTGSTDATVSLVRHFFEEQGIAGKVRENVPFVNFEHNRNLALQDAISLDPDYIFLLDADMEVETQNFESLFTFLNQHSVLTALQVCQKSSALSYFNTRILGRACFSHVRYIGVTHEFLSVNGVSVPEKILQLKDHEDGGCKKDKFTRDLELLRNAPQDCPRTLFYLGQTYWCLQRYRESLQTYRACLPLSRWKEEYWYATYMITKCHVALGEDLEALDAGLWSYHLRPWRAEPLLVLVHLCQKRRWFHLGWLCANLGAKIKYPHQDILFVSRNLYETPRFLLEKSILAYYVQKLVEGQRLCDTLHLTQPAWTNLVTANLPFYLSPHKDSDDHPLPFSVSGIAKLDQNIFLSTLEGDVVPLRKKQSDSSPVENPTCRVQGPLLTFHGQLWYVEGSHVTNGDQKIPFASAASLCVPFEYKDQLWFCQGVSPHLTFKKLNSPTETHRPVQGHLSMFQSGHCCAHKDQFVLVLAQDTTKITVHRFLLLDPNLNLLKISNLYSFQDGHVRITGICVDEYEDLFYTWQNQKQKTGVSKIQFSLLFS